MGELHSAHSILKRAKTPKPSPIEQSIVKYSPGLPRLKKAALEIERRSFSKVILELNERSD